MRLPSIATSCVAILLAGAVAAEALTITNRDEREHKITIIEGESRADHTLRPEQVLENVCLQGCVVRLNDDEDDDYEVEGTDVIAIENGFIYYDGPDAPSAPGGEQTAPPATTPAPAPTTPPARQ